MSSLNLGGLFTSKLSITVAVLTVLWAITDASSRLSTKQRTETSLSADTDVKALTLPLLTAQTTSKLTSLYSKYKPKDTDQTDTPPGLSAELQAEQQGLLQTVFAGDNQLQLKAVIKQQGNPKSSSDSAHGYYALIKVANLVSREQEIVKYQDGDILFGYQLSIDKNTQVHLHPVRTGDGDGDTDSRQITLTMYQQNM